MNKIGIYGGSFDPIHHGHLILAREALEQLGLDKIIFVPAAASPFKGGAVAPSEARLEMLHTAIADESHLAVDDCELRRGPPSYSIDTVQEIRARESNAELVWLIGEDHVVDLPKWHRIDELKRLLSFAVLDRSGSDAVHDYPVICRKIDISGTEIRNRVARGQSIRYLVPREVEEIIHRQNLYREAGQ